MIQPTGYTINPDSFLLKDPLYNKLIVQFANDSFEHGKSYDITNSTYSTHAQSTSSQGYEYKRNGANEDLKFQNLLKGSTSVFHSATNYIAFTDIEVDVAIDYSLYYHSDNISGSVTVSLKLYDPPSNGTSILSSVIYDSQNADRQGNNFTKSYNDQKLRVSLIMRSGQSIKLSYDIEQNVKKKLGFQIYPGATFTVTEKKGSVLLGQQVQCETIFPDISNKDLLKDTLQRFGIICQTDSTRRQITLASFRDIINNIVIAKDWTNKCLNQGKSITFQLGGYAQTNFLKYKEDENVIPPGFADSQIIVDNKTLPATNTLFESQFAPTLNRPYINGTTIAQIKKVDTSNDANATDFSISTQPRLLIHDQVDLLSPKRSIKFTDGVNTTIVNSKICTPYFEKPIGEHSLLFENLKLKYYPELEHILKQTKKVIRYFLLTPHDILELDLLIPVYLQQDGAYYYINKIDSWRKGQPTKVELIKLG